jgi:hypothetical protein
MAAPVETLGASRAAVFSLFSGEVRTPFGTHSPNAPDRWQGGLSI